MRARIWFVAVATAAVVVMTSMMQEHVAAQSASGVMISEYRFRGAGGANDEFVELFNSSSVPVNISGWLIRASANNFPTSLATRAIIPANTILQPYCFYLITNATLTGGGYTGTVPGNLTYTGGNGFGDDGGVALTTSVSTQIIDQVGQGTQATAYGEGARLPMVTSNVNRGIERRPGGTAGHVDTDDNSSDYREIFPGNPQNASASMCLVPANPAITASTSSASVEQGQTLSVFGRVTPGTVPPSTGITVTGDFGAVGGAPNTVLLDDGIAPDEAAGDNIYSAAVNVPQANPLGAQSITLSVVDTQARSASHTITVNVTQPAQLYLPHRLQGAGALSPVAVGDRVVAQGVVTARKSYGFFMQTPAGADDGDPSTSEGLFVFASGAHLADAVVGHLVNVFGTVAEFVPGGDPSSPSLTAIDGVTTVFDLGSSTLPAAVELTGHDLSDAGTLDQLERFEGMRVHAASLTAVSGTGGFRNEARATSANDGVFYAVLTGQARPFRSAGVEAGYAVPACASGDCNVPVFDGNPERLRVDSDGLEGVGAVNVTTGAVMNDVTGVLDFELRTYTLLPESMLAPSGGMRASMAPAAARNQFTVASLHLDRFYDASGDPETELVLGETAFQNRVAKASAAVRDVMNTPDVIGVQDVESFAALTALAQAIDADAHFNGQTAPHYQALLFEGTDPDGLDVGFLVKSAGGRVTVRSVEQIGVADHSRPPVVLRATIAGPATSLPQTVTVIVSQLPSRHGIEADDAGAQVREARRLQAQFLADYVQMHQGAESIVALGDYNAFSFNDGYVDVVGTVAGTPASPEQVAVATNDVVSPELVNVSNMTDDADRYSSVSNGNAQALEHVLVTGDLASQFAATVRPHFNADFPDALRGDPSTPARMAERDPVVVYFAFPADTQAPSFSNLPVDQTVEALGPDGAVVTYTPPTATDNLDPTVAVTCAPASGSMFAVGNHGVTCSAQDAAGNLAETSFTVTVQDTIAPVLTLPANITVAATSPEGRVVTFTATATDAVTTSPAVDCTPASGSTFAVGDTVVTCAAADMAGNVATGTFTVSVTSTTAAPVFGHMAGVGAVVEGDKRVWFTFDVRETANLERGRVMVQVRGDKTRPDKYLAAVVTTVQMSDSPNYEPSRHAKTGIDTVVFSGTGWWNGAAGHRYEITASDRGEPGRGRDMFSLTIYAPSGAVVESVSGVLRDGNIQSLR